MRRHQHGDGLRPRVRGTRFRLFPQPAFLDAFHEPETVTVSSPAGSLADGPADHRMYVVDAVGKRASYGLQHSPAGQTLLSLPPWRGVRRRPVPAGPGGHFDHLQPGTRDFEAAHVFGVVRFVLDAWERYFGHRIEWHFATRQRRLELVLLGDWDNAQSGYGFIELGDAAGRDDDTPPYGLNFDVLAHEVGHTIVYSVIGVPNPATEAGEYFGFHESAADTVALISALHFDSVIDEVLASTRGNLYAANEMNRIAELTRTTQVRMASNSRRMDDFVDGWSDEHALSMPLTGALFDFLLDLFHEQLLARGAITRELAAMADTLSTRPEHEAHIQQRFNAAHAAAPRAFKTALQSARDILGEYVSATWSRLSPHRFSYARLARTMLAVDREMGGRRQRALAQNFAWRSIGRISAGPRIAGASDAHSHTLSSRTIVPHTSGASAVPCYRERALMAGHSPQVPAPAGLTPPAIGLQPPTPRP